VVSGQGSNEIMGESIDYFFIYHLPLKNGAKLLTSNFKAKAKAKKNE
jgi:hypothetical protein